MHLPLVTAAWLAARLDDPGLLIIDIRVAADGGEAGYLEGHVPGAVYSDYAGDGWRQRIGNAPGLLPDPASRAALFARLGITPAHHVILVPAGTSANDFGASARAYWTLKISGHEAVSILEGGTRGWRADPALPVVAGRTAAKPAPAYPVIDRAGLQVKADDVLEALDAGSHQLIDARAAGFFTGSDKASEARRAGRLPGAVSRDYADAFDTSTGTLKPRAVLEALHADGGQPVISYCNTGHSAAFNWFVLSEILGRRDVSLYDGSMTDWTQDDARPVASG